MPDDNSDAAIAPNNTAQAIGLRLREARQDRGLQIADVAATLRIKPAFLDALETGAPERLPTATHASGFLRSYARYLGVDLVDAQRTPQNPYGAPPAATLIPPRPMTTARWASAVPPLLALGGIALLYALWQWAQPAPPAPIAPPPENLGRLEPLEPAVPEPTVPETTVAEPAIPETIPEPAVTAPAATAVPADTAQPVVQPTTVVPSAPEPPKPATPAKPAAPPASQTEQQRGRVTVRALRDSWVQVTDANGRQLFSRLMRAGETWRAPAQPGLRLSTGNAGGLSIIRDGESAAKPLGAPAQVIRNIPLGSAAPAPADELTVDDFPFEDEAQ